MANNLKIKLHEATQNNDGEDSYRFAKITYTFKNPYGVKETFSEIIHFRDRIPVDSIKDEAIESFYEGMRVNGFIPVGQEDEHVVVLQSADGKWCEAEYSDKDRPFKIDYTKYAKPDALRKFVTVEDVTWSNDMYDEFWKGDQYLIDQARKRDKERDGRGEYSEAVSKVLPDADRKFLLKIKVHESRLDEADAYMDALDAELDEIVAAGSAQQQADKADELLKDEPKLNVSDKKYMDAINACHKLSIGRWSKPDTKEISARIGTPVKITGKILKELVANGYMLVEKQGRSNVFTLTPDGEKLLPPPPELDSRVPKVIKNIISSKKDYESFVDALNYLYSAVDKTDLGNVSWVFGNGWQWAYVNPAKRKYYLLAMSEDGQLASVSFSNPDSTNTQSEKGNIIWHWPSDESYYSYIDERIADITKAYAKIKDSESKIYSYSFYSSKNNKNVKNKEEMLKVVEGTKDTGMTYYFRYGFAWKGAGRSKVSYEKFREYCNHAQVDIDVNYNTMVAVVNEFSENDMY